MTLTALDDVVSTLSYLNVSISISDVISQSHFRGYIQKIIQNSG